MDVFSGVAASAREHFRAAAIRAASTLEIFPALAQLPLTSDELAKRLSLRRAHRLDALLELLALEGLLTRESKDLDHPARFHFEGRAPAVPAVPALGWGRLAEVIQTDTPLAEAGVLGAPLDRFNDGAPADDSLQRFHAHLCSAGKEAAAELMESLARKLDRPATLLDLGSGAGVYSHSWLAAREDNRAILLDRPAVLQIAERSLQPFASRIDLRAADLEDERAAWPTANIVLLANLLHLFGPESSETLVERAAQAVAPGGLVVIKDLLLDGDPPRPETGVLFSLNMALFTDGGRVHHREALIAFLERAGLVEIEARGLASAPDAVVVQGRRAT